MPLLMTPMVYMVSRDLPIFVSAVSKGVGAKRIGRKHMRQAGTSAHLTKVADASRLDPGGMVSGDNPASQAARLPLSRRRRMSKVRIKSENCPSLFFSGNRVQADASRSDHLLGNTNFDSAAKPVTLPRCHSGSRSGLNLPKSRLAAFALPWLDEFRWFGC